MVKCSDPIRHKVYFSFAAEARIWDILDILLLVEDNHDNNFRILSLCL